MKAKTRALQIFISIIALSIGSLMVFIQSATFADLLKNIVQTRLPTDLGLEGDFKDLNVLLLPPGVVINKPSLVLKRKNILNLPEDTTLQSEKIELTFQFFQLMTGAVTVNSLNIYGASFQVHLDEDFFLRQEQKLQKKTPAKNSWWQNFVRFNFRSVGLIDSKIDIRVAAMGNRPGFAIKSLAKELTISRGTRREVPSYDVAVNLENCTLESSHLSRTINALKASFEVKLDQITLRDFSLQDSTLYVHANGNIFGNIIKPKALNSDLTFILKGNIPEWVKAAFESRKMKPPNPESFGGELSLEGKLTGDLLSFEDTAKITFSADLDKPKYDLWSPTNVKISGVWHKKLLDVSEAMVNWNSGVLKISAAQLNTNRKQPLVRGKISLENVDFRKLMGPFVQKVYPVHALVFGTVDVAEVDQQGERIIAKTSLTVRKFSFDNQSPKVKKPLFELIGIPELKIEGQAELDAKHILFNSIQAHIGTTKVKLTGDMDFKNGFNLDVAGPIDLAEIKKLAEFDIRGNGFLKWTIKGLPSNIFLGFNVDLANSYFMRLHLGKVKGDVIWDDNANTLQLRDLKANQGQTNLVGNGLLDLNEGHDDVNIRVQVPKATAQDFRILMQDFIDRSAPWYPQNLIGDMTGVVIASGKTALNKLSVEGDMDIRNFEFKGEIFRSGHFHAGYRRGAIIAEGVEVRKRNGWLRGDIRYNVDETLDFNMESSGLSTGDIDFFGAWNIPYTAPIEFKIHGKGKPNSLTGKMSAALDNGSLKNLFVPLSRAEFTSETGRIKGVVNVLGGQGTMDLDVNQEAGSESSLSFALNRLDFKPLLIALNQTLIDDPQLDANVSGRGQLRFKLDALSKFSGNIDMDSFHLSKKNFEIKPSHPLRLNVYQGNYSFDRMQFIGNDTDISMSGRVVDGAIDYDIHGKLNLGIIEYFTSEIPSFRGAFLFNSILNGQADAPNFICTGEIKNADLRLASIDQPFENLNASVSLKGGVMAVQDGTAKVGGGIVTAQGTAGLSLSKAPDLNFLIDFNNSKFKIYPFSYVRLTGRIAVRGDALPYKVEGAMNIAEALIQENFSSAEGARVLRSSQFLPKKNGTSSNEIQLFDLGLDMNAERGILVRNDLFDVEAQGKVRVLGNVSTPRLLGQMEVSHGKLLFKDNSFTIQTAVVNFNNPAVLDPEFDLTGTSDVKGYKVSVFASGKSSSPSIAFKSQPPLSQQDIVSLLTLGVTSSNFQALRSQDRDAYSGNEVYSLLFSQSGINRGLKEKLGVKVGVDQAVNSNNAESAFRPNTDASVNVAPRVYLQKEVIKNLNAKVGSTVGVGDSRQQDMNLEYRLGRNTSVLGVYEDQRGSTPKNSRTSLGVDVKFRWNFR